jgi:hypothetical protein
MPRHTQHALYLSALAEQAKGSAKRKAGEGEDAGKGPGGANIAALFKKAATTRCEAPASRLHALNPL